MTRLCIAASFFSLAIAMSAPAAETGSVILDQYASWRMFHVLKAPEIDLDDGLKPIVYTDEHYWLNDASAAPPSDWNRPDFDDGDWLRGPTGMQCRAPFCAKTYLRGRFRVSNPSQVKSLRFEAGYHGGIVVYLNGEEVGRKNLKPGADAAEAYPAEAFIMPDGKLIGKTEKPPEEMLRRIALRRRTVELELPVKLLRQGVNVLAVELVRAPCHKAVDEQKLRVWNGMLYNVSWNPCELLDLRLTADGRGVEPNASRPTGFQVWNSPLLRSDFQHDFGDPCEPLRPMVLSGARNGMYSEKVVAGSTKPIRGLKVAIGDLRGKNGIIPASALRVRYGVSLGSEYGIDDATFGYAAKSAQTSPEAETLSMLLDVPPAEYAPVQAKAPHVGGKQRDIPGAVAPVWLTVHIPKDAKPGTYEGVLTLSCEDEKPVEVPVRVNVANWTLPNPDDFRIWTELIQSPDTLALEYNVPLWSDKHFEYIARSFRLMREVGSSSLYLPLICCTHYGNEESIVRWIKKGEKEYEFDFTALDRYLDAAEKNLGKPKILCFIVWDIFLLPSAGASVGGAHGGDDKLHLKLKDRMYDPFVTTLDPATGKVDRASFPNYFKDADCKAHWTKLFGQLREKMKQRGLEQAMMLGWFTDFRAQKDEIAFWRDATGNLPWVSHAHNYATNYGNSDKLGFTTGYQTSIHSAKFPQNPAKNRTYGWKNPMLQALQYIRVSWRGEMDMLPGSMWLSLPEINIAGQQRGFGRIGADSWPVLKDKKGRRVYRAYERYPWSIWSGLEQRSSILAPGPDGAVATNRLEQLREGVQLCEARIALESVLTDPERRKTLDADFLDRCQAALDEHVLYALRSVCKYNMHLHYYNAPWTFWFQDGESGHAWFQSTGWRDRNARLYELAGEADQRP